MIVSTSSYKGPNIKLVWHELDNLSGITPITQSYGLCFTPEGKVLIIRNPLNKGKYSPWYLPGGTPEKNETPEQTLQREVMEEADIEIANLKLLGAQEVFYPNNPNKIKGDHYYQLRYFALITKIYEHTPDPHDGQWVELKFIDVEDFTKYVSWGDIGDELIKLAKFEFGKLTK